MVNYYKILVANLYANSEYVYSFSSSLQVGQIVQVEFGKKVCYGICYAICDEPDQLNLNLKKAYVIKPILKAFDYVVNSYALKFAFQCAEYNLVSIGSILQLMLSADIKAKPLSLLYEDKGQIITLHQLLKLKYKRSVIEKMENCSSNATLNYNFHDLKFTPDQEEAIEKIAKLSNVSLLSGSTGSGKTLVALKGAFENMQDHLKNGGKILIITPEISLGVNWGHVILKYFNQYPCFYNYKVSNLYKTSVFAWALSNEPGIIIGARSALFLPYKNLRMIIIDEEHSSSLKQERYPCYQARDMAVLRCNIERIPCLLISATASLETQYNIQIGKYSSIQLSRTPIHGKAEYQFVQAEKFQLLASNIINAMGEAFANGQQVLLFLNRRGYAPYCICSSCNHVLNCKGCDVPMIFYNDHSIICHKCGYTSVLPTVCLYCNQNTTWKFYGIGIERLLEFTKQHFKDRTIEAVTSKTKELDEYIEALNEGKIDCLIATQVLAQGHDFKNISLVVIVDGDMGLNSPDFRANERIYQLWQQLRGRSARHGVKGKFIVQAISPSNRFLNLFNSDDIYHLLLEEREKYNWPPFSRCAFVIIKSKNYKIANLYFQLPEFETIRRQAKQNEIEFYGPLHSGKQNFVHEWRFLVKVLRKKRIDLAMRSIISLLPKMPQIKVEFEIDPYIFT